MSIDLALTWDEMAIVRCVLQAHLPTDTLVYVFGSRATGKCKPWSDLDLLIDSIEPMSLSLLACLVEAFDKSDLAWKVDLVDQKTVSAEFMHIIDQSKIPLEWDNR